MCEIIIPMKTTTPAILIFVTLIVSTSGLLAKEDRTAVLVREAMAGAHRSAGNSERDQYRHPVETLAFFGLTRKMTVVEVWPGRGWYTEILAPVLRKKGKLYAAGFAAAASDTNEYRKEVQGEFVEKLRADSKVYGKVIVTELGVPGHTKIAPEGSADLVLTFRNVHNWTKGNFAPEVFSAMYKALKPGGTLGVVEHRAKEGTSLEAMNKSGYVTVSHVKALAKDAGFQFVASSEVNANPKDTADHPMGVWTLPPVLRLTDQDRAKYLAIGESDRMTLKFLKPAK